MDSRLRSLVFAVATAQFLLPFFVVGIIPLLPELAKDLNANAVELGLTGVVYSLSVSIFHLVMGRVGDIIGRRRLFLYGLLLFLSVSAITPFSPNMPVFLLCRFFQAVGTACMNTSALAILTACAPPNMRGRVLGLATMGLFAGVSCGPAVGGFIASLLSWHWLFFSILPVGALAWYLMAMRVEGEWFNEPDKPFDWTGSVIYTLSILSLATGAVLIVEGLFAVVLLCCGILGLVFFVHFERGMTVKQTIPPILDIDFLTHNKNLLYNILVSFFTNSTLLGQTYFYGLYLQTTHGLTVGQTGLVLSIQPVLQLLLSPYAGKFADVKGHTKIATFGIALCSLGLLTALGLSAQSPLWLIVPVLIFSGMGMAFFGAPNASATLGSADNAHLSQISGVAGTVRTFGMFTSTGVFAVAMSIFLGDNALSDENVPAFLDSMHLAIFVFLFLNAIAIILSLIVLRRTQKNQHSLPKNQ